MPSTLPSRSASPSLAGFAACILLAGWLLVSTARAETLVFAPLPLEKPEALANQWRPVLDHLEKSLGADLRMIFPASHAEIIEKFRQGEIDLAYLGPLPYLELKKVFPEAEPLVHIVESDGQAKYTCAIVALAERKLTPKALRGKTIALTQALSTCGYWGTEGILRQAGSGLGHNRYRYLGAHDKVALAVARGDVDAGGLKTTIGRRYEHLGVQVVAESVAFPGFALIANARKLSAQRIGQIRAALLAADAKTLAGWGGPLQHGVEAASDRDYDGLRQYDTRKAIPQQGNY